MTLWKIESHNCDDEIIYFNVYETEKLANEAKEMYLAKGDGNTSVSVSPLEVQTAINETVPMIYYGNKAYLLQESMFYYLPNHVWPGYTEYKNGATYNLKFAKSYYLKKTYGSNASYPKVYIFNDIPWNSDRSKMNHDVYARLELLKKEIKDAENT